MKKYKIGVFGSSAGDYQSASQKAKSLGKVLSQKNCTIITGASSGLPYLVAFEGNKNGAEIIGFSPELNMKNQKLFMPNDQGFFGPIISRIQSNNSKFHAPYFKENDR